jgi:hypothetical protein
MRAQESVLGSVSRLIGIAHDEVGGPEGNLLVVAHELLEGRRVATPGRFDPFTFEQWTALHLCHPYTAGRWSVP